MPPKRNSRSKFIPKDLVLAKMHGFPAWPSFVMPSNMIPDSILDVKKKTTDYCVIFIPDGDFYWMNEKNLEALSSDKLSDRLDKLLKNKKGKGTSLIVDAFTAAKGLQFEKFMRQLRIAKGGEPDEEDDEEEEEEEEAEREEEDEGNDDEEEAAEENEDQEMPEEEEDEAEDENPKDEETRKPKNHRNGYRKQNVKPEIDESEVSTNITNDKEEVDTEAPSTKLEKKSDDELVTSRKRRGSPETNGLKRFKTESPGLRSPNGKSNSHSKNGSGSNSNSKHLSPEEKLQQLWLCRIKLQKSLIQRNAAAKPTIDELLVSRLILHKLVDFQIDYDLLKATKIHKVLKCIIKDKELEYPDTFKLHDKCQELLNKWTELIDAIKLEKTNRYLNNKVNDDPNNTSIDEDKKIDESEISDIRDKTVKSPNELNFASVES